MKVLFLDDDENRHTYAQRALIGHDVHYVRTVAEAVRTLAGHKFDVAMLDHDLGGTHYAPSDEKSGYQVALAISGQDGKAPQRVIVHSYNAPGAARMIQALSAAEIPCAWVPFGPTAFRVALETA